MKVCGREAQAAQGKESSYLFPTKTCNYNPDFINAENVIIVMIIFNVDTDYQLFQHEICLECLVTK